MAQHTKNAGNLARDRILGVIETSPGVHVRRLSVLTGTSWNTCLHHLRVLERSGHVTSRKVQGKLCWFDTRSGALQAKEGICLLRDHTNLAIAQHIMATPGTTQIGIASALDLAASVVHRRVVAMEAAGLLHREAESRSMHVTASEKLQAVTEGHGLTVVVSPPIAVA